MNEDIIQILAEETSRANCVLAHDPTENAVFLQWRTPLVGEEAEALFEPMKNVEENIGVEFSGVSNYRGDKEAGEFVTGQVIMKIAEKDGVSKASAEVVINRKSSFVSFDFTGMSLMKHAY